MSNPQILNPCPVKVCHGGHEAIDPTPSAVSGYPDPHRCDICLFGPAIALRPFTGMGYGAGRQLICFPCRERFHRLGILPAHPSLDGWRYHPKAVAA